MERKKWRLRSAMMSACVALCVSTGCTNDLPPREFSTSGERLEAAGTPSLVEVPRVVPRGRKGWVEVEAEVLASDDESPAQARRRAIDRARLAAVEYVAGISVRSSVITLDQTTDTGASDLLQALTATQADALIVDEKLLDHRMQMDPSGAFRVRVKMAARVLERDDRRAQFDTEVRLNADRFRSGERVEVSIRVSEAARIYVLAVSREGAVVLLPNRYMPDTRIDADEWLTFPGKDLEGRGVALQAVLPDDVDRTEEALLILAMRGSRRLESLFPASGDDFLQSDSGGAMGLASDFLSPLLNVPAEDWTFDQIVYSISRD